MAYSKYLFTFSLSVVLSPLISMPPLVTHETPKQNMSRPLISTVLKSTPSSSAALKQPAALVGVYEHRLSAEAVSPMVSLAMTLPAGAKFSCGEEDCGQIAAAYKHAILQVNRPSLDIY